MSTLFVTGTDTGVGKTAVTAGLARLALRQGARPGTLKPAETGCDPEPLDARFLARAAGNPDSPGICPNVYRTPAAPAVAARLEGRPFDLGSVLDAHRALVSRCDLVLVEGAGGLLVPYADDLLGAELAERLGATVLVVARVRLGTLNHTLLTVRELERRRLPLAGVILSDTDPDPALDPLLDNAGELRRLGVPVLGTLRHLTPEERTDPDRLADAVGTFVSDPRQLLAGPRRAA